MQEALESTIPLKAVMQIGAKLLTRASLAECIVPHGYCFGLNTGINKKRKAKKGENFLCIWAIGVLILGQKCLHASP